MARIILAALLISLVSYVCSAPAYYNVAPKQKVVVAPIEAPVPVRREESAPTYQQVVETTTPALEVVPTTAAAYGMIKPL